MYPLHRWPQQMTATQIIIANVQLPDWIIGKPTPNSVFQVFGYQHRLQLNSFLKNIFPNPNPNCITITSHLPKQNHCPPVSASLPMLASCSKITSLVPVGEKGLQLSLIVQSLNWIYQLIFPCSSLAKWGSWKNRNYNFLTIQLLVSQGEKKSVSWEI